MTKENAIRIFEEKRVRSVWDSDVEKWYISIIDVIEVLTGNKRPRKYWDDLKRKLKNEGSELSEKIGQMKMLATDGKMRVTDVGDVEQLFRLIQSIPSPKAEPFKVWLAQIARERLEEIDNPEQGIDRLLEYYHRKGYSASWINQRLKSIEVRKDLTDEWEMRGVKKGQEFANLTDIITNAWAGMTTKQFKQFKGLKTEGLRDNMTSMELILNMLAEATTTEISKERKPTNLSENQKIALEGGTIAGNTRKAIEAKTGKKIVSRLNAKTMLSIDTKSEED
ncbi:MAG: BRO family protein [Bacteroidales bacterium]|jgi:hypothetical protein